MTTFFPFSSSSSPSLSVFFKRKQIKQWDEREKERKNEKASSRLSLEDFIEWEMYKSKERGRKRDREKERSSDQRTLLFCVGKRSSSTSIQQGNVFS